MEKGQGKGHQGLFAGGTHPSPDSEHIPSSSSKKPRKQAHEEDEPHKDPMTVSARLPPHPHVLKKTKRKVNKKATKPGALSNQQHPKGSKKVSFELEEEDDLFSVWPRPPLHRGFPRFSKFNKPGAYRHVLDPKDPLFRADRAPKPLPPSIENPYPSKNTSQVTEATSESGSTATSATSKTSNFGSQSEENSSATSATEITGITSNSSTEASSASTESTESVQSELVPIISSKSPKRSSKYKGKKRIKKAAGHSNLEDDEEEANLDSEGTQTGPPGPEEGTSPKDIIIKVIHPIKPLLNSLSLRRTDGREDIIEETEDEVQTETAAEARLLKKAAKDLKRKMRNQTGLTKSEGQMRKNRVDGMITKMKDWTKPPTDSKPAGKLLLPTKKLRFGAEKVHPEPRLGGNEVVKLDVDVSGKDQGRKRKSKGAKGKRSSVIRVRASKSARVSYKFTPLEDEPQIDRIGRNSVNRATILQDWLKEARRTLPSAVGVPVQTAGDVMSAGLPVVEAASKRSVNPRKTYNTIYDEMQRHQDLTRRYSLYSSKIPKSTETSGGVASVSKEAYQEIIKSRLSEDSAIIEISEPIPEPTITKKVAALKLLAEHLAEKRKHKQEYVLEVQNKQELQNKEKSLKGRFGRFAIQTHRFWLDAIRACTIWRTDIYQIHGKYGLGAAAYFRWVRKILTMNVFYFLFTFVLVIFPETIGDPAPLSNSSTCSIEPDAMTMRLCQNWAKRPIIPKKKSFSWDDLLIGNGFLENSYLYYSGYRDTTADPTCPKNPIGGTDTESGTVFALTGFRLAFVCLLIFVMNSIYISIQVTHFYHVARLESRVPGLVKKDHFKAVLCAWDFNCSDENAAKALHRSIWYELKELAIGLENMKSKTVVKAENEKLFNLLSDRFGSKIAQSLLHWLANIGVFFACLFAGGVVYFSYYARILYMMNIESCNLDRSPNWVLALPAIFISFTTYGMSKICVWVSHYEHWDSLENRNWAVIGRVGMYYLTELLVTYGYWLHHARTIDEEICYEELFGQELYRIVVFQGIVQLGGSALISAAYHNYKKRKDVNYQKPEFDSASLTLSLFFMHTLAGFGFLFCPLISLLVIGRLILTFYHRKYTLLYLSSYPQHLSHNSEIAAPYLVVFFVTYLLTSFLNVYLVAELNPSAVCGPFSHFRDNSKFGGNHTGHYYDVFVEGFTSSASGLLILLVKPAVALVFIMLLSGLCYTFGAWAGAYVITMEKLHDLLILERQDRDFLLKSIFKIVKKQYSLDNSIQDDNEEDEVKGQQNEMSVSVNDGTTIESSKTKDWSSMALALGIFSHRKGSMAKQSSFDVGRPERRSGSGEAGGQPSASVDYSGRRYSLGQTDRRYSVDQSGRKSLDSAGLNVALQEAIAPTVQHHATFKRESVDLWVQEFLRSKRTKRRSAVIANDLDQEELARRFRVSVWENDGLDEDDEDEEFKRNLETPQEKRDSDE